jgi:hypothetical protein
MVIVGHGPARFHWGQVDPLFSAVRTLVTYGDGGGLDREVAPGTFPLARCHFRSRSISQCRGAARARRRIFRLAGCLSRCRSRFRPHLRAISVPPRCTDPGQELAPGGVDDRQPIDSVVHAIWRQVLCGVTLLAPVLIEVEVMVAGVAHFATSSLIISAN